MQVYRRVANPYMPNGTPDLTNAPNSSTNPFYAPGEIGCAFSDQSTGGEYLRVNLDSGATASTSIGVVAAGQVAYWKDQSRAIVTNDKNQCDVGPTGAVNRVAGFFQLAVTAGNVCDLVIRHPSFNVQATGTIVAGGQVLCDTTANTARTICGAAVNTAPVTQVLGAFKSATITNNLCPASVAVGFAE